MTQIASSSQSFMASEEEEVEKLELEVKQMAQKILELRSKLPHQLITTLDSLIAAQRPGFPITISGLGQPELDVGIHDESGGSTLLTEEESVKKIALLKQKFSRNRSCICDLLERMEKCISRIKNSTFDDDIIPVAFK